MADGENSKISNVLHFCRVDELANWLQGLSAKQKNLVNAMGAGFVFSLKTKQRLDTRLTNFLVHNFCCDKGALEVEEGTFIEIRSRIKDLYDMPSTETKLHLRKKKTKTTDDYVKTTRFSWLVGCRITKLWETAKAADTSDDDFCVLFMLGLLNTFLAPSGIVVDTSFLIDLIDHQKIKEFDWCTFIADYLIARIDEYKQKKAKHVCGCLHILHLIYADYVKYTNTDTQAPRAGFPRCRHITDAHLKYAARKVACVSLKKKSSYSADVESMDSSPQNSRRSYRTKKARAAHLQTAIAIIDIRRSVTSKMISVIENCHGAMAGDSSYEQEQSSYCRETGTEISGPVQTSGGNGSLRTTDEGAETREAPDKTLPVKGGSKFQAIESTVRLRSDRVRPYIGRKYARKDRLKFEESYDKHVLRGEISGNPKVSIRDASVTAEQFVNSLKEGGEVTEEFVNVSVRALIQDWKSQCKYTSLIIDLPTVVKILDENCTPEFVDEYLRKEARIELLERIYILLNNKSHWVLCIMSLQDPKLYLFCPTLDALERGKEHGVVAENVVGKLQRSLLRLQVEFFSEKMKYKWKAPGPRALQFCLDENTRFPMVFPDESKVDIKNAGVYIYLLHLIEDHMGDEILECAVTPAQVLDQTKRLAHMLVDHEWNILNPKRVEQELE